MGDCLKKPNTDDFKDKFNKEETSMINTGILIKQISNLKIDREKITDEVLNLACIKNLNNEIHVVPRGSIQGCNIDIDSCQNSIIIQDEWCSQALIDNCENCFIVILSTLGSFFARKCKNCVFVSSCQQFRISFSENCTVSLCALSSPTMEGCNEMTQSSFSYPKQEGTDLLLEECAMNMQNNKYQNVYDFNTQQSGKNENNQYIVARKKFYEMLEEYKLVTKHDDQSKLDYLNNEELLIPYKSNKSFKNPDTFLVMIACQNLNEQALKLIYFDDDEFPLIESFQTKIQYKDLGIIFKDIDKLKNFTNDMAQFGFLTLKFAPKIQIKIDQFEKFIKENLDSKSFVMFLNGDPDQNYVDNTIFTEIYNLGVNV